MHYLYFDMIIFKTILMAVCINSTRQTSNKLYPQLKEKSYVIWCISSQYLFIPFQPTNNRKHEVKFLCCKNSIIIILPQIGIINM